MRTGVSSASGRSAAAPRLPSAFSVSIAAACPSSKAPCVENVPLHAPAVSIPGIIPSRGTKLAISLRHSGRPFIWQVKCTDGFQPPDSPKQSAAIFSTPLCVRTLIDSSPLRPPLPQTCEPVKIGKSPVGVTSQRLSINAATCTPALCRSCAVRCASSLLPNTTTSRPGATPQRLR